MEHRLISFSCNENVDPHPHFRSICNLFPFQIFTSKAKNSRGIAGFFVESLRKSSSCRDQYQKNMPWCCLCQRVIFNRSLILFALSSFFFSSPWSIRTELCRRWCRACALVDGVLEQYSDSFPNASVTKYGLVDLIEVELNKNLTKIAHYRVSSTVMAKINF